MARRTARERLVGTLDGLEVLGLSVLLLGLSWSEAAKSAGLALAVLALLGRLALGGRLRPPARSTFALLGCYVAASALSVALAPPGLSGPGEVLSLLMTVAAFPLAADVCRRRPSRRLMLAYAIVAGAAVGAVLGYADHLSGDYRRLVLPSIENAVPAGEYLAAVIGLAVPLLLAEAGSTVVGPMLGLSVGLYALAMFLTRSRGPMLGAAAGGLLALWLAISRRWVPLVAAAALVVGVAVFGALNPASRVVRDGVAGSRSAGLRARTWAVSLDLIAERPLTGHGEGSFANLDVRFVDELGVTWEQNAHNVLLHELVETGVLGAGALVGFVVLGLRDLVRALRRSRRGLERAVSVGCLAGVAALLVCGVVSVSTDAEPGILLFALLGLGASVPPPGEAAAEGGR